MAINKKGSRKIVVGDHEFRWRASGNDGWITVVIWPIENENSKVVGNVGYHNAKNNKDGTLEIVDQIVVTNRMIRQIIDYLGVDEIVKNKGQMDIGAIEDIFDVRKAVRGRDCTE